MYNLRLFMHNKLVIIELVMLWLAVISICTTGEAGVKQALLQGCIESTTFQVEFVRL